MKVAAAVVVIVVLVIVVVHMGVCYVNVCGCVK